MKLLAPISAIKEQSHIEPNVEPAKVKPAILEAQRIHVQTKIGTTLYQYFLDAIQEDGTLFGCTSIQTTFYDDYLVPMLAKYSEAEYSLHGTYQRTNVGTIKAGSERIDKQRAASHDEVKFLYQIAKDKADSLAQRAIKFIKLDANQPDLGDMYEQCDQSLQPSKSGFSTVIYTGKR